MTHLVTLTYTVHRPTTNLDGWGLFVWRFIQNHHPTPPPLTTTTMHTLLSYSNTSKKLDPRGDMDTDKRQKTGRLYSFLNWWQRLCVCWSTSSELCPMTCFLPNPQVILPQCFDASSSDAKCSLCLPELKRALLYCSVGTTVVQKRKKKCRSPTYASPGTQFISKWYQGLTSVNLGSFVSQL